MPSELRPFGLWESALQARDLAQSRRLRDLAWDSDGRTLVWLESRGAEGVLVCQKETDAPRDLTVGLSVRARVGYGGGDFCAGGGHVYFCEHSGRLYRQSLEGGTARPITPEFGQAASPALSPDGRFLAYVHAEGASDCLAMVDAGGRFWPQRLAEGADFYMQPAWHPSGRRLAWIEWDQPQMPWEGTRLVLGELALSRHYLPRLKERTVLEGDERTALFQPAFSPDGRFLAYASDRSGWSQIWLRELESGHRECLTPEHADVAPPAWVQGLRAFSFAADGRRLFFTRCESGQRRAYQIDLQSRRRAPVEGLEAYTFVEQLSAAPRGRGLACIGSSFCTPSRIVALSGKAARIAARSAAETLAPEALSRPEALSWTAADGTRVHGLHYPPASTRFRGQGRPPLIVNVHGGPTAQASAGFEGRCQYFATRGWAVLDLNHRGSSGYGRRYVEALRHNWGLLDVEDAVEGARALCERGLADPERLVLMGGSAGGYTVLRALTLKPGFFRAGICLYGISNLFTLAADTHKFEARYLDDLVGPLPEAAAVYRERSPIFAIDKLRDPVALFHGSEDQVVPPSQAEQIVASLRRRNVPHEYHLYEGEGHGWRRPETIEHFYKMAETFLRQHVLFA